VQARIAAAAEAGAAWNPVQAGIAGAAEAGAAWNPVQAGIAGAVEAGGTSQVAESGSSKLAGRRVRRCADVSPLIEAEYA
jgi:hypothetical protein